MNIQEQEEQDFYRMSPYEFEAAAIQQEGANRASQRYLLTNFDTWVLNPFWDGIDPSHPEAVQQELEEEYREAVHLAETKSTEDGGCPWCGKDCPDAARPQGCWFPDCPDEPHA